MKKLFFGLALLAGSFTFAQTNSSPVTFGVKGGMNVANLSNTEGSKSKIGFNAGAFANIPVAESFSVQPEVLFSTVGAKSETVNKNSLKFNLNYISVPVMLQYNVVPNLYLEAGPQFGFLVGSKLKDNNGSIKLDKNNFKGFDFGIGIGAGYYFSEALGITARYVAGVSDIIKNNNDGKSVRNNVFQVGLSLRFK
jgi:hypothetical protein